MNIYPAMVRTNARYRGPIESLKSNNHNRDLVANLKYLYDRLTSTGQALEEFTEMLIDGAGTYVGASQLSQELHILDQKAQAKLNERSELNV